eukprot:TRINITY_DN3556_c0_g1_i1.p1 TRINITY_DN3556_c0_g1~~TRINITY_DN3556_c0_g1_i1.p1  ORF type:complete len:528 (+),score=76.90 TRINITY_DN3556_c0_g1_i1:113-1696(+)
MNLQTALVSGVTLLLASVTINLLVTLYIFNSPSSPSETPIVTTFKRDLSIPTPPKDSDPYVVLTDQLRVLQLQNKKLQQLLYSDHPGGRGRGWSGLMEDNTGVRLNVNEHTDVLKLQSELRFAQNQIGRLSGDLNKANEQREQSQQRIYKLENENEDIERELRMTRRNLENEQIKQNMYVSRLEFDIDKLRRATEAKYGFRYSIDGPLTDLAANLTRNVSPIPRVDGRQLSYKEFYLKYVKNQKPVIITNYFSRMFSTNWTLDEISYHCGHRNTCLQHFDPNRNSWGNLYSDKNETNVGEFIERVKSNSAGSSYLFDWSIPRNCPSLLKSYTVPKYFATDFFQRVPDPIWGETGGYKYTWPSLFIGGGETRSGLHVDAVNSHFWMAMILGHKRWGVVTPDDVPFLYPNPGQNTFLIDDIFDVDPRIYPLVGIAKIWEAVLEPGDMIFVPGGSAHQIRNLDTIMSMSMNFIDAENFERSTNMLRLTRPAVQRYMIHPSFPKGVPSNQKDLHWEEFKTFPRDDEVYDLF